MSYDDYRPTSSLQDSKDSTSVRREFFLYAEDEIAAYQDASVPAKGALLSIGTRVLVLQTIGADQVEEAGPDENGNFLFRITLSYVQGAPSPDKATWRIDGLDEKVRVYAVEEEGDQVHYGPTGSGAQLYDGTGINVTEDGAQGVDVDDGFEVLNIDFWKDPDDTEAFLEILRGLHEKVNDAEWEGPWGTYEAGEARLKTWSVSHLSTSVDQVSVSFLVRKNKGDGYSGTGSGQGELLIWLDSMGEEVPVDKGGHQYLWVRMQKWTDPDDDSKNRVASLDAHVATLYRSGDFSTLGITPDIWV